VASTDTSDLPAPLVGWFRYDIAEDSWRWSEGMYRVHGLEPGSVVPTTALMLAHQHPDDRDQAEMLFRQVVQDGEHFIQRHQIFDLTGALHAVVTVGGGDFDGAGTLVAVHGYMIDLTESIRHEAAAMATEFVERALTQRVDIDQAKGALMVAYGLSDSEAFAVLRWHSQHANIKIRDLAAELMSQIADDDVVPLPPRRKIATVLSKLTTHSFVVPPELITVTQAELQRDVLIDEAGAERAPEKPVGDHAGETA
jgi:ANTAR domain/PAS fold